MEPSRFHCRQRRCSKSVRFVVVRGSSIERRDLHFAPDVPGPGATSSQSQDQPVKLPAVLPQERVLGGTSLQGVRLRREQPHLRIGVHPGHRYCWTHPGTVDNTQPRSSSRPRRRKSVCSSSSSRRWAATRVRASSSAISSRWYSAPYISSTTTPRRT